MYDSLQAPAKDIVAFGGDMITKLNNALKEGGFEGLAGALGDVLTEAVKKLVEYVPKVVKMAVSVLKSFVSGIIAALPEIIPMLTETLVMLITEIGGYLPELLNGLIDALSLILPDLMQAIANLLTADNATSIFEAIVNIITNMVDLFMDNIDMFIDVAILVITAIADGLLANIDVLLDKAPLMITQLARALIKAAVKLGEAALEIIGKFVLYILDNFSKIEEVGKSIVNALGEAISGAIHFVSDAMVDIWYEICHFFHVEEIYEVGKNIIEGLWNGISSMADWIREKISGFGETVLGALKSFFGIASPSKVMRDEVGKFLAEGIGVGFTAELKNVKTDSLDALQKTFDFNAQNAVYGAQGVGVSSIGASPYNAVGGGITVNINVDRIADDYDVDRMSDRAVQKLSERLEELRIFNNLALGGVD